MISQDNNSSETRLHVRAKLPLTDKSFKHACPQASTASGNARWHPMVLKPRKNESYPLDTHFSMSLFLQVFCMVSCLLLSPLLVEGISVGGKTDELVTEHLITEMKQSERVTVSEAEDPTEPVSCHFLEREETNTTCPSLAGRTPIWTA